MLHELSIVYQACVPLIIIATPIDIYVLIGIAKPFLPSNLFAKPCVLKKIYRIFIYYFSCTEIFISVRVYNFFIVK